MEGFVFKLSEHIYLCSYSLGTNTKNKKIFEIDVQQGVLPECLYLDSPRSPH